MDIFENVVPVQMAPNDGATTTYALSAGTSDVNSVPIDMQAYQGSAFALQAILGTITSTGVGTFKLQHSDSSGSGFTDITGASVSWTDTDSNKMVGIQVNRITKRYIRVATDRGTANSVIAAMIGLIGGLRKKPATGKFPTGAGAWSAVPSIIAQ